MRRLATVLLAAIVVTSGCAKQSTTARGKTDDDVVATFDGGRITMADLDHGLLALPAGDLRREFSINVERLGQFVRQLAFQRLLVAEARRRGLDRDPEFQSLRDELRREVTLGLFLETHPLAPAPPTEAELRAWYHEHVEMRRRPARRLVYHIFKRYRPDVPRVQIEAEVAELRRRVMAGEPFPVLAAAHSDSELRHREGFLGVVEPGQLPAELDAVVFSLDENIPSELITTRDGVHLFLVKTAVEDKDFSFEDLRVQAVQAVRSGKLEAAVSKLVEEWRPGGDHITVDDEKLRELLAGDDPEAVLMRVDERELTVADLRVLLARVARLGGGRALVSPTELLESLEKREVIYQRLVRDRMVDAAEVERLMEQRVRDELAVWYLELRLVEFLSERPGRLQEHYESNAMRFADPLRLELRRLVVPLGVEPVTVMARLEAAREGLDAGDLVLPTLAAELGGRTEDLGWVTLAELQRLEPKAVMFTDQLTPGRHSPPFRGGAGLQVLCLIDRNEPEPKSFDSVRKQVSDDFLRSHQRELVDELADEMLGDGRLEVSRDRLQLLIDTGFGAIDQ